jgi:PHD/YefM family antitoxin component YafN of YafNO toxin-antitoxin module
MNENKNLIIITQNGEAKAVLMDVDSYRDIQNAFSLIGIIKEDEKEIEWKDNKAAEVVFQDLEKSQSKITKYKVQIPSSVT